VRAALMLSEVPACLTLLSVKQVRHAFVCAYVCVCVASLPNTPVLHVEQMQSMHEARSTCTRPDPPDVAVSRAGVSCLCTNVLVASILSASIIIHNSTASSSCLACYRTRGNQVHFLV